MIPSSRSIAAWGALLVCAGCNEPSVQRVALNLEPLGEVRESGGGPEAATLLQLPVYLRSAGGGDFWTLDTSRKSAVRLSERGRLVDSVGRPGRGPGELSVPLAFDVGPDGRLWIADPGNGKVVGYRAGAMTDEFLLDHQPLGVVAAANGELWVAGDLVESVLVRYDERGNRLGSVGVPEGKGARWFRFNQGIAAPGEGPCAAVWAYTFYSIVECFGPGGESVWRTSAPVEIRPPRDADPEAMSSGDRFAYVDVTADDRYVYALFVGGLPGEDGLRARQVHLFEIDTGRFAGNLELAAPAKFILRRDSILAALDYDPEPLIRLYRVDGAR